MKRFTATEKWDDPWFRALSPEMKCFWYYLCDKCDHAGVWQVDFGAASFFVGHSLIAETVFKAFRERVEVLPSGQDDSATIRWRVLKFVHFQYPNLSEDCKPHAPVFAAIQKHGLSVDKVRFGARVFEPNGKAFDTLPKGFESLQEKEKEKETDTEKETVKAMELVIAPAEQVYAFYPKKVGKKDAIKAIAIALKIVPLATLLTRTEAYCEAVERWPESERKWVPNPATWFNRGSYEDDPLTWVRTSDAGVNRNQAPVSTAEDHRNNPWGELSP